MLERIALALEKSLEGEEESDEVPEIEPPKK